MPHPIDRRPTRHQPRDWRQSYRDPAGGGKFGKQTGDRSTRFRPPSQSQQSGP
jgi:hypothetical protein